MNQKFSFTTCEAWSTITFVSKFQSLTSPSISTRIYRFVTLIDFILTELSAVTLKDYIWILYHASKNCFHKTYLLNIHKRMNLLCQNKLLHSTKSYKYFLKNISFSIPDMVGLHIHRCFQYSSFPSFKR